MPFSQGWVQEEVRGFLLVISASRWGFEEITIKCTKIVMVKKKKESRHDENTVWHHIRVRLFNKCCGSLEEDSCPLGAAGMLDIIPGMPRFPCVSFCCVEGQCLCRADS